ncbi:hypothetical protein SGLAD_v1c04330 [Spiroplasma gladiatoris]|uniref:Uncharacterized protein n=1 Tax=Spiroplasma gladiatoris TaxID=2143 RepID=A0A4P7AHH2_9MOLU|nr:hypothetical protein [Spiroplasma gladiatoris]QBQ07632.1 hypothetical protein SGLAD_v1c04330 [Spiroplasma gladiatoris]
MEQKKIVKRRRRVVFRGKTRRFLAFFFFFLNIFYTAGSFGLTIPGISSESLKYLNEIENKLPQTFQKNNFVITAYKTDDNHTKENETGLYDIIIESAIKPAFINNVISKINFNDPFEVKLNYQKYLDFANKWYEQYWSEKIINKEDIDLYDLALNLLSFEKKFIENFKSKIYSKSGIGWLFSSDGLSNVFSKELYEELKKQQTTVNQNLYNQKISSLRDSTTGQLSVDSSPGTFLLNNTVWFVNEQIETINLIINNKLLNNQLVGSRFGRVFTKTFSTSDIPRKWQIDDFSDLWFTKGLTMLKWGTGFLITCLINFPMLLAFSIVLFIRERGYIKPEKKQRVKASKVKFSVSQKPLKTPRHSTKESLLNKLKNSNIGTFDFEASVKPIEVIKEIPKIVEPKKQNDNKQLNINSKIISQTKLINNQNQLVQKNNNISKIDLELKVNSTNNKSINPFYSTNDILSNNNLSEKQKKILLAQQISWKKAGINIKPKKVEEIINKPIQMRVENNNRNLSVKQQKILEAQRIAKEKALKNNS